MKTNKAPEREKKKTEGLRDEECKIQREINIGMNRKIIQKPIMQLYLRVPIL